MNFNRVFHYKPSILGYHYIWGNPTFAIRSGGAEKGQLQHFLSRIEVVELGFIIAESFFEVG